MPYPFEPNLRAMSPENLRKFLANTGDSNSSLDRIDIEGKETNLTPKERIFNGSEIDTHRDSCLPITDQ